MKNKILFSVSSLLSVRFVFSLLITGVLPIVCGFPFVSIAGNDSKGGLTQERQAQFKDNLYGNGIRFTPNKGQLVYTDNRPCADVLYKGDGAGSDIYLRRRGISYVFSNIGEVMHEVEEKVEELIKAGKITEADELNKKEELSKSKSIKIHRVDMDFEGCNNNLIPISENELDGNQNFYYSHCPDGITGVREYNKVICKNIYKNIDVIYFGDKTRGLKYDLIVQPHGDPNLIKLRWKGAENICLNSEGNLVIKTSVNEFFESIPKVYQIINGAIVDVKAEYKLISPTLGERYRAKSGENVLVTFELGKYDSTCPLIIDPWISYYGGSNDELAYSVTNDNLGNVMFSGFTKSVNFPVSPGPFQSILAGTFNAVVVSLQSNGSIRNFATYYGGTSSDYGYGITSDASNNVIFCGNSNSVGFPTGAIGANVSHQTNGQGFVVKLNNSGVRQFATCYDGVVYDVNVDGLNNIVAVGSTTSAAGIATGGVFQPAKAGGVDPFVVKFQSNGLRLWGTYFGGAGGIFTFEKATGVCCNKVTNEIYFIGSTNSGTFPVFAGHQMALAGGDDAFLVKLSPTGGRDWATYYGGTNAIARDFGLAVSIDVIGNVIMSGWTFGSNPLGVIATAGAYQTVMGGGGSDAFVVKFNSSGVRQWGTYLGGSNTDYATGVGCDANNNIVVGGDTYSLDFSTTSCAYQPAFAGTEDQFICTLSPAGSLICSSYIGIGDAASPNNETADGYGGCISVFGCYVYLGAGSACNYPVTPNAYQTVCGGGGDACIAQLDISSCGLSMPPVVNLTINTSTCSCTGAATLNLAVGCKLPPFSYIYSNGAQTINTTSLSNTVSGPCPGAYTYTITMACDTVYGNFSIISSGTSLTANVITASSTCGNPNGSATVNPNGGNVPYTYLWSNTQTNQTATGLSGGNYTVTISDAGSCTGTAAAAIISTPLLIGQFAKGTANCIACGCKEWIIVNAAGGTSPYTYTWPDGYVNRYKNQLCPGAYTVNIKDKNGCSVNVNLTAP